MRWLTDQPLRRKLMLITLGIVLAATASTLLFLHQQAADARRDEFERRALSQARLVAEYVVSPLVFDDAQGGREVLAKFAQDARVAYVRLDDAAGAEFARIGGQGLKSGPPDLAGQSVLREDHLLHVAVPVNDKRRTVGQLRAGFRATELDEAAGRDTRFLLLLLGAVMGLSFLLAHFLQRLITTPLLTLQAHANRVAETHDYSTPLAPPGKDEVGSLYAAFNHLMARIKEREAEILDLNRSLEAKVVERTRDLEAERDRADEASRGKSEFLANMSHEIRTPINAVMGFTALALRTELDARQRGYLQRIETASAGLLRIVNDLLDFSKIEAGKVVLEHVPFRLSEVTSTVLGYVGTLAEQKGLELLVDIAADVPPNWVGDPLRLGQVLINLCSNAVKFTTQGEVELRVLMQAHSGRTARLLFSVRDTGIGLSDEQAARLFQAFVQADTSTTRRFGGTGLGLVISQRLTELMRGRIWLESSPGVGTTFFVEVELEVAGDLPHAEAAGPPPALQGARVLVVDDNAHARQILVAQLTALGMRAQAVESAAAAIAALRAASAANVPFPIVLMDWKMPGADGIAATRAIRADPSIAGTPVVIMVTAYGREQALAAREDASLLDGVLLKPVTPELLAETLLRALGGGERVDCVAVPASRPLRLYGAHLLLAEDNPINQQLASELLQQEGATLEIADDGAAALAALARNPDFDAVLMDLQMPVMDGYEAARRIRAQPRFAGLPVIAMTAHAMAEERERCLAVGMNDHISKPIDPEAMVNTIAQCIGAERLRLAASRMRASAEPVVGKAPQADLPPSLPGLDLRDGLQRCNGDEALYRRLLGGFAEAHRSAGETLAALAQQGDAEGLRFASHRMRGAAANLSAVDIAATLGDLERAARAQERARWPALIDAFSARLQIVLASVDALQATSPASHTSVSPTPESSSPAVLSEPARVLVRDLASCLASQDTRAERLAAELARYLDTQGGRPGWVAALIEDIDALEYGKALQGLSAAGVAQ
jgi:signal transduction histidine kinase/DNA-binding response OmpR family regulator/HPt (histidine-containing phosphotransfer) domain-containing protein